MNLHNLVRGAIGTINPFLPVTVNVSAGYTTNPDGSRVPVYNPITISAQVQSLTYTDLTQLDGLNITGVRRAIYTNGYVAGIVRIAQTGGDVIRFAPGTLPEGDVWLCVQVLETWDSWVKIAITLQDQT